MDSYRRNRYCSCLRCMSWNLFGAAIIITVGVLELLDNLRVIRWQESWPVFLIVFGALKFAQNGAPVDGHVQPRLRPVAGVPPQDAPPPVSSTTVTPSSEANHG